MLQIPVRPHVFCSYSEICSKSSRWLLVEFPAKNVPFAFFQFDAIWWLISVWLVVKPKVFSLNNEI
jgi:hypothetical protein